MAKDVITRFKLETTQYDSKLKTAARELADFGKTAKSSGRDFNEFTRKQVEAARGIGSMATSTTNAKQKTKELVGAFNDLARSYNQLTDAQKQSDFGKAMSHSLTELQRRIRETKQEMQGMSGGGGMGGLFGGKGGSLGGMLQVFGGNLMTKAAGWAASFASEMGQAVQQGVELARQGEGIRNAFERLGRGDILDGLREATHGTVTDLELMKAAVKFNDFNLPLEELGTMLAFAQQKAKDTGQSVDYMVDSIVTGLGRKSLMILDNLGLSATQIKDKMAETGDMTKAVGEIIREQMAKAGDYVETAADRATKANVELENAMTSLGETFQPLTDAANSMWNDIKIGALDLLNSAIKPLVEWLTKAGQLKAEVNRQGGNAKVDADIEKLKGSNYKPQAYQMMLSGYFRNENQARNNLLEAQKGGKGSIAIWQNQYDAAKSMREMFQTAAQKILNPVSDTKPLPVEIKNPVSGSGGSGNTNSFNLPDFVPAEGVKNAPPEFKPMWDTALFQEGLRKEEGMDGEQTRDWGKELGKVLANYIDDPDKAKRRQKGNELQGDYKSFSNEMSNITQGVSGIVSGIKQLGIDIPEGLESVLGGIQAVAGILTGISALVTIITAIQGTKAIPVFGWLLSHGGVVPHAANGYYVPGTHSSGDVTPIMANAGELVLNKSSQNNLANELKGAEALVQTIDRYQDSVMRGSQAAGPANNIKGGNDSGGGSPYLTGEVIYLGLSAYLKSSGRGEIVTSRSRG